MLFMRWDIFCRVIDNFGDIGVCWRLCADLATRGHHVRLWVDDTSALGWMAPGARQGHWPGVQVLDWEQSRDLALLTQMPPADVWVESFGCEIAPEFIAFRAQSTGATGQKGLEFPVWINLEYLSAEAYVERSHGLPSPVMQGPAQGATKHFFYPGFTQRTGGLLRETDLTARMAQFDAAAWLAQQGVARQPAERLISLFCYEPAALPQLLAQLANHSEPTRLMVTVGRASAAVQAAVLDKNRLQPLWNERKALSISYLPSFSQQDFDHLLWACDLNFVRGEDSVIRALWAGKPLVWQIYPQDDAAHHDKLDAFLDQLGAGISLRQFHHAWNGLNQGDLPPLELGPWAQTAQSARARLLQMDDLASQLASFVAKSR
nr:elongation factor P maturation arginine rhamnosyltransferase EarP [Rhodoferax saidenbachensis]